jgi:hypothetical protein
MTVGTCQANGSQSDVPDSAKSRQLMRLFKSRWKIRLEQLELWMVSYRIEVE